MTVHRWFANKACPGDYIYDRLGQIAKEVNARSGKKTTVHVGYTKIAGQSRATVEQMRAYIKSKDPDVPKSVLKMIPLYLSEGEAEGIRGDVAFAQSCLETGNFTFRNSAVTLAQNNFCGMGVTSRGMKGSSFKDRKTGIRAQIQHLKAYADDRPLVNVCVDPRFKYVERGCAKFVEYLGIKENPKGKGWASGAGYGQKIMTILKEILRSDHITGEDMTKTSFKVKVTTDHLNIRTGPGTDFSKTGKFTGIGVFTITEVREGQGSVSGWGRLKSGAGWICLDCVTPA